MRSKFFKILTLASSVAFSFEGHASELAMVPKAKLAQIQSDHRVDMLKFASAPLVKTTRRRIVRVVEPSRVQFKADNTFHTNKCVTSNQTVHSDAKSFKSKMNVISNPRVNAKMHYAGLIANCASR